MPSRSYKAKCRDYLKTLKRRKAHLQMRTLENERPGIDYNKMEIVALDWAITICEQHLGQEKIMLRVGDE